jgi:hypothetical protein
MDNIIPNHPNNPDQPDDDEYEQRLKDLKQSIYFDKAKILANLDNADAGQFILDLMTEYFEFREAQQNPAFNDRLNRLGLALMFLAMCDTFRKSIADTVAARELRG